MLFSFVELGLGISCMVLRVLILRRGHQLGLWSRYPAFFVFVSAGFILDLFLWVQNLLPGRTTDAGRVFYFYSYGIVDVLLILLAVAVLAELYSRFKSGGDLAAWSGLAAFTVLMSWFFYSHQDPSVLGLLMLAAKSTLLHFAVLFLLLIVGHLVFARRYIPGATDFLLMLGFALHVGFQYLGWTLVTTDLVPYATWRVWVIPTGIIPWVVWALAFRRYVPATRLSPTELASLERGSRDFSKAVQLLVRR